ncbi:hypothetical protein Ccrd_000976 [Cynara cardunculus var. scolymus]|uniref:Uncharacterized protein n=1 Tax=Cynara cardunculus var. scolymus TaxID=59895 RepID=A0A103XU79_CYNCS|nr:hypothetical protein Ccrd_000976 [Cynara cardunculus var. scolymus]
MESQSPRRPKVNHRRRNNGEAQKQVESAFRVGVSRGRNFDDTQKKSDSLNHGLGFKVEESLHRCFGGEVSLGQDEELGRVVDVFIARKRDSRGLRFGFVRFLGIKDVKRMEKALCEVSFGSLKLRANVAKYVRKATREVKGTSLDKSYAQKVEADTSVRKDQQVLRGSSSYADAVKNGVCKETINIRGHKSLPFKFSSSNEMKGKLKSSLIGKFRSFDVLCNFQKFGEITSSQELLVRYLGGLYAQVCLKSYVDAQNFLFNNNSVWSDWFSKLDFWNDKFVVKDRIAFVTIHGVPIQAWTPSVFAAIAGRWGEVIIPENCLAVSRNREFGKVGILAGEENWIMDSLEIIVDGILVHVSVAEDIAEGMSIGSFFEDANGDSDSDSFCRLENLFDDGFLSSSPGQSDFSQSR